MSANTQDKTIWEKPKSNPAIFPFLMAIFNGYSNN